MLKIKCSTTKTTKNFLKEYDAYRVAMLIHGECVTVWARATNK